MIKERYAYFAYLDSNSTTVERVIEVEWIDLEENKSFGTMLVPGNDFWGKTREELWQEFEKWSKEKLENGPDMIAVDPIDESL